MSQFPPPQPLSEVDRNRLRDEFALASIQGWISKNGFPSRDQRELLVNDAWVLATALVQGRQQS
jgi:hypothetical protein